MRKILIFAFMMTLNSSFYSMESDEFDDKELLYYLMYRYEREFPDKEQIERNLIDEISLLPDCKEITIGMGFLLVISAGIYFKFMVLGQS